ncbi:MAG: hypothetical protein ABR547_06265 [Halanaerobium sp.]
MRFKKKAWGLVFVVLALMVILSGCESGGELSDVKDVRKFAGSVGPGDFINIEVNVTDKYLDYEVRDLGLGSEPEIGRIDFTEPGSTFYVLDNDDKFLMLGSDVLIATDKDEDGLDTGEEILTALKEMDSNDANEISGKYNIITSLEGAPGIVDFNSNGEADIQIDLNGNGSYNDPEEGFIADYSYNENYKALEIIEDDQAFKHYGIFLDGEIGIFDSYASEDNGSSWEGDGMSILVKQNSLFELIDFAGTYDYIDVDGYNGEITISVDADNIEITYTSDEAPGGTETTEPIPVSYYEEDNTGLWSFSYDMNGNEDDELWTMMLFEKDGEEILVLGVTEDSKEEGLFGWDGDESNGGMVLGVKQ